jgi:hypothetical protein
VVKHGANSLEKSAVLRFHDSVVLRGVAGSEAAIRVSALGFKKRGDAYSALGLRPGCKRFCKRQKFRLYCVRAPAECSVV